MGEQTPRLHLVERSEELQAVERALLAAATPESAGAAVAFEGRAGIGKTSLLAAAAAMGRGRGLRVMRADGAELERDLAFGAVRQLIEPVLRRLTAGEQRDLFAGPARVARPLFDSSSQSEDEASLIHGLFWLLANLSEPAPAVLIADDLQWWDRESLRFLDHVTRRLDDLPVALVSAVRSAEESTAPRLVRALLSLPAFDRRSLRPLSHHAILTLTQGTLEAAPTERFVAAVHDVTRGNPLYVREILASVRRDRGRPDDLAAHRVASIVSEGVAANAQARIESLGPTATVVARAISVLGRHATTAATARLAGIAEQDVARTADELELHGVVLPSRPLEFSHPVVRTAVHDGIPTGRRLQLHREAAELLRAAGGRADEIAAHLLETEPSGDAEVARMLRDAAGSTTSPDRALSLLHRALAEPPASEDRADVLLAIGDLEARRYEPTAVERLDEARALAADRESERRVLLALTRAWTFDNRPEEVVALVDRELAALDGGDGGEERELRLALVALRIIRGQVDRERALGLREEATSDSSSAARYLLAALAYKGFAWGRKEDTRAVAEEAFARGMASEGVRATGFMLVTAALENAGELRRNVEIAGGAVRVARDDGDVSGYVLALCINADVVAHRSLIDAGAEIRDALALSRDHGLDWIEPVVVARSAEIGIETGDLDEADDLLSRHVPTGWQSASSRAGQFFLSRGRLRLAQGRDDEALEDAFRAGELSRRFTIDHPAMVAWRSTAARALAALGRTEEARPMADDELSQARSYGAPEVTGRALLAWAATRDRVEAHEALEEAVGVLEAGEGPIPLAHAYVEHGSSLRRLGERSRAKDQMSAGLDLAARIGATVVAERAMAELRALGARPRRAARSGPDSLTPSELRVAELAAEGLSNKDIAKELFVSVRTVGNQLQRAYLKLDIRSRQELGAALAQRDGGR